jgi:hypothetical protein
VEIDSAVSYDLRTLGHPLGPAAREIRNRTLLDTAEGVVIPGEQDLVVETTMTLTATHSNLDEIRGKDSLVGDCLLAQEVDDEAVASSIILFSSIITFNPLRYRLYHFRLSFCSLASVCRAAKLQRYEDTVLLVKSERSEAGRV